MQPATTRRWDIFCEVIDNHGDLGVCWRLAADLAARGHHVRLWVDDAAALAWMAPGALEGRWPRIQVRDWQVAQDHALLRTLAPGDVWVEGFGCTLPAPFVAHRFPAGADARDDPGALAWVNLEYLSAEAYVERSHGLPSPILQGPAAGQTRYFYFPGFTPRTGGLLREPDLLQRQARFDPAAWRAAHGVPADGAPCWSLFCYEPRDLVQLLQHVLAPHRRERLLVTAGRAHAEVQRLLQSGLATHLDTRRLHFLPSLAQSDYDHLLWSCACNFVRGEDSLVRALWAGTPWVWHIYPQDDGAHHAKLQALLDLAGLPDSWQDFQRRWNRTDSATSVFTPPQPSAWRAAAAALRDRLRQQTDLTTQLIAFVDRIVAGRRTASEGGRYPETG